MTTDEDLEQKIATLAQALREAQRVTADLEAQRNQVLADLIDEGYSTYKVAALAGLTQPRVVQLNNRQRGGEIKRSPAPRGKYNQEYAAARDAREAELAKAKG